MTVQGESLHREPGEGGRTAPFPRFSAFRLPGWRIGGHILELNAPRVMGILNLTPDSFSDGGQLPTVEAALSRGRTLVEEGAEILDVGGESTRPGAGPVPPDQEMLRVVPVIEALSSFLPVPISVDTRNAQVAREALRAGASIVNDVSGLAHDEEMAAVVAEEGGSLVLSHMRGTPATMKELAVYEDVRREVREELGRSLEVARSAGIPESRIVVDPGIGFAKTGSQSLRLLGGIWELGSLGRPILLGPSRKSFIGELTGAPPVERAPGTLAACVLGYVQGVRIFRVHDVAPLVQALAVTRAIIEASE